MCEICETSHVTVRPGAHANSYIVRREHPHYAPVETVVFAVDNKPGGRMLKVYNALFRGGPVMFVDRDYFDESCVLDVAQAAFANEEYTRAVCSAFYKETYQ